MTPQQPSPSVPPIIEAALGRIEREHYCNTQECGGACPVCEALASISHIHPDKSCHDEVEEYKSAYTALKQLVEAYQMGGDVDVNWEDFPKDCLSMAHKEILDLRQKLKWADDHMAACRALLNVPDDEVLYVAIKEMKERQDRLVRALRWIQQVSNGLVHGDYHPGTERDQLIGIHNHAVDALINSLGLECKDGK